jgi:hypothetical protein
MLARASPLNPRVEMVSRSSKARSLLVVCLQGVVGRERGVYFGSWPCARQVIMM